MGELLSELLFAVKSPLIYRALIVGGLVSLCAAMLGVVLVLKHYALIGHGLGEVGFAAMAMAMAMGISPLTFAIPVVIAASLFIMWFSGRAGVGGDAAIGVIATAALALGVVVSSTSKGYKNDVYNYLFGSVYSMTQSDVYLSVTLSILVIVVFILLFNRLFSVTFDELNARATGLSVNLYQFVISFLTALTVVLGMRMMGAMLISSFIIFPAMTARRLVRSFRAMVIASAALSLLCFVVGMSVSYLLDWPTGASVVGVSLALLLLSNLTRLKRT